MGYKIGTTTFSTTGLKTLNLGAPSTPVSASVVVQNKLATNEGALKHVSIGETDGTNHKCTSYLKDGSSPSFDTQSTTGTLVKVYEVVGGVNTVVLEANFDSFTANGIKINVVTANSSYPVYIKVEY